MGATAGQLAIIVAALFTGAALYVSVVHQSTRLTLGHQAMLADWKPAYARGFAMQAPLAAIGFLLGLFAFWQTASWLWFIGALLMMANWPYTMLVIMPTNRRLEQTPVQEAGDATRALVEKWGRLHDMRTLLGLAATVSFFCASVV